MEGDFSADHRHAEAVAVVSDALHYSGNQVFRVGQVRIAEAQAVEGSDGPGSHGEDVAVYPADPGGRSLVGLNGGGVIMAFDLEGTGQASPNIDETGVFFPGADQ